MENIVLQINPIPDILKYRHKKFDRLGNNDLGFSSRNHVNITKSSSWCRRLLHPGPAKEDGFSKLNDYNHPRWETSDILETTLKSINENRTSTQNLCSKDYQSIENGEPPLKKAKCCGNIVELSRCVKIENNNITSKYINSSSGVSSRSISTTSCYSYNQSEPIDLRINYSDIKNCKSSKQEESHKTSDVIKECGRNDPSQQESEDRGFLGCVKRLTELDKNNYNVSKIKEDSFQSMKFTECQNKQNYNNISKNDNSNICYINKKLHEECQKILHRLPIDHGILNIPEEKILEVASYKPNMVRSFPSKERSAEEVERRRRNTEACRISRRKKKLENLARVERITAVRKEYVELILTTLKLLDRVKNLKNIVRNELENL